MKGVTMATIDKRISSSGKTSFRVRTRLKGFLLQVAAFLRKTDAERWAASKESAQREGRYFTTNEATRHTLGELVDRYQREVLPLKPKNARNQRVQLDWWKAQLGCFRLVDVTPAKIAERRDLLRSTPMPNGKLRTPATVVRYLAAISHAFTVAMKEWGWVVDSPLRKVTKPTEARGRTRSSTTGNGSACWQRVKVQKVRCSFRSSSWRCRQACAKVKSSVCGGNMLISLGSTSLCMKRRMATAAGCPWQALRFHCCDSYMKSVTAGLILFFQAPKSPSLS